jgi:hypothetical protein
MRQEQKTAQSEALEKIQKDRRRTNMLRKHEQQFIAFLVRHQPKWMTSNILTGIGFAGSILTAASFFLAKYVHHYLLLLGIVGLLINWYGDSLDGRLAYYRNKPRKWFGFSLDFCVDWLTIILIGFGFIIYADGIPELLGFAFVTLYGWAMIMAQLRYKLTDTYTIDSGLFGPTEVRIFIGLLLVLEVIYPDALIYSVSFVCAFLFVVDIIDFRKLLRTADEKDIAIRTESAAQK